MTPGTVRSDGVSTAILTVALRDRNGRPVSDDTIRLDQAAGHSAVTALNDISGLDGLARFSVRDVTEETVTYTATDINAGFAIFQQPQVKFTTEAIQSTVVAAPTSVPANGSSQATVTVTLREGAGKLIAGHMVSLVQGGGHSAVQPATAPTGGDGVARFRVTDTTVETVTYSGSTPRTASPSLPPPRSSSSRPTRPGARPSRPRLRRSRPTAPPRRRSPSPCSTGPAPSPATWSPSPPGAASR